MKCDCGFEFVTDRPLTAPVEVVCPQCRKQHTLHPAEAAPAPAPTKVKKGADN